VLNEVLAKGLATVNVRGYVGLAKSRKFGESQRIPETDQGSDNPESDGLFATSYRYRSKKGKDSGPIGPGIRTLGSRQDNQNVWTATVVAREARERA